MKCKERLRELIFFFFFFFPAFKRKLKGDFVTFYSYLMGDLENTKAGFYWRYVAVNKSQSHLQEGELLLGKKILSE